MSSGATVRRVLTGVGLAALCIQFDAFAVNLVLPRIGRDLGGSGDHLGWVVSAYLLACGSLMLGAGRLGDLVGHGRLLRAALIGFVGASALCALAPTLPLLVVARAVQGAAAAPVMPAGLALLSHRLPPGPRQRATGLALGIGGLGTACGPLVGGVLAQTLSWRAVFWLDLPCALVAVWLVGPSPAPRGRPLSAANRVGLASVTVALAALALLLDRGPVWGWGSAGSCGLLVAGVLGFGRFLAAERSGGDRLLRPELLRQGRFTVLTAAGATANAATVVVLLVVPWTLQEVWGLSPLTAAAAFLAPAAGLALAGPVAGLIRGAAAFPAAVAGLAAAAALLGAAAGAVSLPVYLTAAAGATTALGLTNALAMTATQALLPPAVAGEAAGLTKTVLTMAAGLGVLLIGPGGRLTRVLAAHALGRAGLACLVAALLLTAGRLATGRPRPTAAAP
ncbi:MFS transporter [Kitasatospora sp. McL0602]|uniref:MFS transporter n=1 Tax=Kitasatospora sp. McL0602 TaxID=3439530 RepID=UPI003F8C18FC